MALPGVLIPDLPVDDDLDRVAAVVDDTEDRDRARLQVQMRLQPVGRCQGQLLDSEYRRESLQIDALFV